MVDEADERLEAMYRRFSWRITSNYVSPWELDQIRAEVSDYEQWCATWSRWAEKHLARAADALAAGRLRTAADAYVRAGLFYHWASFLFAHEPAQLRTALEAAAQCFERAAPLLDPPMEMIDVSFEGVKLHGYLRVPNAPEPPPLVLLLPGADSTKEELFNLAEHMVERGLAIAAFDGPGQGLVSFEMKLRPDYEVAVHAMLDALLHRADIDPGKVGVAGISYGGLFACRAAASDERVRAVVSMSSWYSPAGRFAHLDRLSRAGVLHYMGPNAEAVLSEITLAGVAAHVRVPVLQIYGAKDPASPPAEAARVAAALGGPVSTVVFDDGVHVCNNVWYQARPLAADWLAETLQAAPEVR